MGFPEPQPQGKSGPSPGQRSVGPDTCHSSRSVLRWEPDQNLGWSISPPLLDFKFYRGRAVLIPLLLHLSLTSPWWREQCLTQSRPTQCLGKAVNKIVKLPFSFASTGRLRSHWINWCNYRNKDPRHEKVWEWLVLAWPPTSFGGVGVTCVGVWGAVDEGREVGVG